VATPGAAEDDTRAGAAAGSATERAEATAVETGAPAAAIDAEPLPLPYALPE
jgi:hypothetical protein